MAIRTKEDLKATVAEKVLTQQLLIDMIDSSTDTGVGADLASHEANTTNAHGIDGLMNKASSSTANNIVLFSDISGKNVKNSNAKITSNGSIFSGNANSFGTESGLIPSIIIGYKNTCPSTIDGCVIFGENNTCRQSNSIHVLGNLNEIDTCSYSLCFGFDNRILVGVESAIIGNFNTIIHNNCIAIGENITTSEDNTVYIKNTNIKLEGNLSASGFKSGASQVLAGASAGEIWKDTADNTLKVGV